MTRDRLMREEEEERLRAEEEAYRRAEEEEAYWRAVAGTDADPALEDGGNR